MLQIRLKGPTSASEGCGEGGGGGLTAPTMTTTTTTMTGEENVRVACPEHLVLADLPVAKSLGSSSSSSSSPLFKIAVGRRSRRQLGERVHFCVRCDFPISIYGRLSPCDHAFCLDCARSDSICYLCDERIQKIQTIKMMEGIFVCAAPHCLKSFLKKSDFEFHIHDTHSHLLHPPSTTNKPDKDDPNPTTNDSSDPFSTTKQSTPSDSTPRPPPRPLFSPLSTSQLHDRDDKPLHRPPPPRDQPPTPLRHMMQPLPPSPLLGQQFQNHPSDFPTDNNRPQGFDRPSPPANFFPQTFTSGIPETPPFPGYPNVHAHQPPNFAVPLNPNPILAPPPFNYPLFTPEGVPPYFVPPYEMPRPDSALEVGSDQGSLLGFPPGPVGANFPEGYSRPWNVGPAGVPFEPSARVQGVLEGFQNMSNSQGRVGFFPQDYGRNTGAAPSNMPNPASSNNGLEAMQGGNSVDPREGKGILASQPFPPLLPPQLPTPHSSQVNHGYSGEMARDGQGFAWQHERRDSFGSGQDQ